jgi:putative oxidoreductase
MSNSTLSMPSRSAVSVIVGRTLQWLDRVPYGLLALPLRLAVATVFWNSSMVKLANWGTTIALFTDEYNLPLLPPAVAAVMAAIIELTTPVLLVLGLLTRLAALVLLGMTTVIELFVYPQAWPTHIQWAAMLLVLLCRGAGTWSIDRLLWRRFGYWFDAKAPSTPGSTRAFDKRDLNSPGEL